MTTQRVIIDSTAASPFRVSVAGVDASSAQFNDLIFDGNQSPIRLWATGYILVDGTTWNDFNLGGKNTTEAGGPGGFTTPSGTTPVFVTMWRRNDGIGKIFTPSFQASSNVTNGGGGGGICSGQFLGLSFNVGAPGAPTSLPAQNYTNYCIFKNYA